MKSWRQTPAVPTGARTGGPCPRLGASLLRASQSCPVRGEGLMSEPGRGLYRCQEVLEPRHKPQAQQLLRWTVREAWCSWMGSVLQGTGLPQGHKDE